MPSFSRETLDSYRVARLLRQAGRRLVGFVDCGSGVSGAELKDLALHLAGVLEDAGGGRVGVILLSAEVAVGVRGRSVAPAGGSDTEPAVAVFELPAPQRAIERGSLAGALASLAADFDYLFIPLTEIAKGPPHLPAFGLMDGIVVVARCGATTEAQLLARHHEVGPGRCLGVLLLD